jgi:hypothetical protein
MDPKDAAPLATRGAVVLTKALENPEETDSSRLSSLASALGALVQKMDPKEAVSTVKRSVNILIPHVSVESEDIAPWIIVLWAQCPSAVEPRQVSIITTWLDAQTIDLGSDAGLLWLLLSLATPPPASQVNAARGTKMLIQSLRKENTSEDSKLLEWREELQPILGAKLVAALTLTLAQNLEREADADPSERQLIARMIQELREPVSTASP